MKSGVARLAAALAVTVGVVVLAVAVWRHFDPLYNRSAKKCEAAAVRALPKGSKLDHHEASDKTYRVVWYQLPVDPAPSVDAIEKNLRERGELRDVRRDGTDRYAPSLIVLATRCTTATITVRRISPPLRGATAEVNTQIED
jgi:hypothetical protein